MDIYFISAVCNFGKYLEKVEVYPDMGDKPKSYTGHGRRIDKSKIGVVEDGLFKGGFQMFVLNQEDIQAARIAVREKVSEHVKNAYENAKQNKEALDKHDVEEELKIKSILD